MLTGATLDWFFINCNDAVSGGAGGNATFVNVASGQVVFRDWRGGLQLNNHKATNSTIIDGAGRLIIEGTSTAGSITIRGDFPVATNAATFISAGGTITQTQRFGTDQVMADTAGTTAIFARLGAPAGASVSADVAAVKAETASILADTAALGGAGSNSCTITVTDGDGAPIEGCQVWITSDEAGTDVVASGTTSATGVATFMLDDGTWYSWRQLNGYNFTNPETIVVS
jgi:hypothetical protein